MKLPTFIIWSWLSSLAQVQAKSVFAHFMVGNTASFGVQDWESQIGIAQLAGIDAFALNMANADSTNDVQVPLAFEAASNKGFQLFFSFDYAGNGPWSKTKVINLINQYGPSSAYFHRGPQPFVSTFEGPANANDWVDIKSETGCFFIPDWSSIGAQPAVATGVVDGLFSWDAWPKGPADMTTYPDASYYDFLHGKPYMMPVSPWFYTNLPGYNKNWLWRGDNLWFQRWQQVLSLDQQPDYVEIISWNDYGESHYIGPLDSRQLSAFTIGEAPFNYVDNMPHDGWRAWLPYIISLYKTGTASITEEGIVTWYRPNPNGACSDGGTTGNTASQLQLEYSPNDMMADKVYFTALLTSSADVTVSIGGATHTGTWDQEPYGGVGLFHGSVPITGTGPVIVTLSRNGQTIATVSGTSITTSCSGGFNNYNAWVGTGKGPIINAVSPPLNLADQQCVAGFGVYEVQGLCSFACYNGYCPHTACICLNTGIAHPPNTTGVNGYPLPGHSAVLQGLCSFDCNHGYCPDGSCGTTPNQGDIPTTSPFLPPACTAGTSNNGAFLGLCSFGCNFGFCPMHACTCTGTGPLNDAPPREDKVGYFKDGTNDYGLCNFACSHGYCPDVCGTQNQTGGGGGGLQTTTVTVDPAVWTAPTAQCPPPCILVFPPTTLPSLTTISLPPLTTTLELGWSKTTTIGGQVQTVYTAITVTTTIIIPSVTTSVVSFSNVLVTTTVSSAVSSIILVNPSINPAPFVITPASAPGWGGTGTPASRTILPPPWPYGFSYGVAPTTTTDTSDIVPFPSNTETGPWPSSTFPSETVSWVTNYVPEPTTTTVDGSPVPVIPCWAWFIFRCPPNVGGFILKGFKFPGVYPRGGPPAIGPPPLPPGITLPPILWPEITIGPNLIPTYEPQPNPEEDLCETATASLCTDTISYGIVAKRGAHKAMVTAAPEIPYSEYLRPQKRDRTTTTTTISFCTQVTGCGLTDITSTATQASVASPTPWVIIPNDPMNANGVRAAVSAQSGGNFFESQTNTLGTIFFFVSSLTTSQAEAIRVQEDVEDIYVPRGALTRWYWGDSPNPSIVDDLERYALHRSVDNASDHTLAKRSKLAKRAEIIEPYSRASHILTEQVMLSWPPGAGPVPLTSGSYRYDDSAGFGTFIYGLDFGISPILAEFSAVTFEILYPGPNPASSVIENDENRHGTACMSRILGKSLGVAKKAKGISTVIDYTKFINEHFLDGLARIHEDIRAKGRGSKAVVNISLSFPASQLKDAFIKKLAYIIRELLQLGAVVVTGSGNVKGGGAPYGYPALLGDPGNANYISDLMVVGSSLADGGINVNSADASWITCWAAGFQIPIVDPRLGNGVVGTAGGTSLSSAIVAGLAGYFRALEPDTLNTAAAVKAEIVRLSYTRDARTDNAAPVSYQRNVVWNGQRDGGTVVGVCPSPQGSKRRSVLRKLKPRQNDMGNTCPLGVPPPASSVTFRTGAPTPTCSAGGCGQVCSGFFCQGALPTQNPDFLDPLNPDSVQNPTGPNFGDWDSATPTVTSPVGSATPTASNVVAVYYAHGGEFRASYWYYMVDVLNGVQQDICSEEQLAVVGASEKDPNNPGDPSDDPTGGSINLGEPFSGTGTCAYSPGQDGGIMSCQHVSAFVCHIDHQRPVFTCASGSTYPGDTMSSAVRCRFPS